MNRILDFKIWDTEEKKWISALKYAQLVNQINCNTINGICIDNGIQTRYSVRQFTGFKDKNDKDIYEGDTVRLYNIDGGFLYKAKITWVQKDGGWMIIEITDDVIKQDCSLCDFMAESCEVIDGN
jgi:uncharacterized phage protein (TIGR01671 family)